MKPIHYVLLTIAGIILLVVAFNWDSVRNFLFGKKPITTPKTPLELCQDAHKSLPDNTACTTCTDQVSSQQNGTIKDGQCIPVVEKPQVVIVPVPVPKPQPKPNPNPPSSVFKLKVSNPKGAPYYKKDNANKFVEIVPSMKLPFGQKIVGFGVVKTPDIFYQIQGGWVSAKDVQITP